MVWHDSVAVAVVWKGRDGFDRLWSHLFLWLWIPLLVMTAALGIQAAWDVMSPGKRWLERALAGLALMWLMLGGGWGVRVVAVGDVAAGYDTLAAWLSSTSGGGLPLMASLYTVVFAGFIHYALSPAAPTERGAQPAVSARTAEGSALGLRTVRWLALALGVTGVVHFATGMFGG